MAMAAKEPFKALAATRFIRDITVDFLIMAATIVRLDRGVKVPLASDLARIPAGDQTPLARSRTSRLDQP